MFSTPFSLIILGYNDAASLVTLLPATNAILQEHFSDYEIIVVNDGSLDNTIELISDFKKNNSKIHLVSHYQNLGVGATFKSGLQASKNEIVAYMDGDGQYDPADLIKLFEALKDDVAIASGYRIKRADNFKRKMVSSIYNFLLNSIFKIKLNDINSGLKIYRRSVFEKIGVVKSNDGFFDAEILLKAKKINCKILEIPISHYKRRF